MNVWLRAAISVSLLVAFFVGMLGGIAASVALAVWYVAARHTVNSGILRMGIVAIALAFGLVMAVRATLVAPGRPDGVPLDPAAAPLLWDTVAEVAAEVGIRAPDRVHLVAEAGAAVRERAGLLGLRRGRRDLYLGVPALATLTVAELRAVLAHEFGHYLRHDARLRALTWLGHQMIVNTMAWLSTGSITRGLVGGYFRLYRTVSAAVVRQQEYAADQAAGRVAGMATTISALRTTFAATVAWQTYLARCGALEPDQPYLPAEITAGFARFLDSGAVDLAAVGSRLPRRQRSTWDTHPPLAARVEALICEPPSHEPAPADPRPAGVLVPDLDRYSALVDDLAFPAGGRTVLPFDRYTVTVAESRARADADILYRAAAWLTGTGPTDLGTVLGLLADGQTGQLAAVASRSRLGDLRLARGTAVLARQLAAALTVATLDSDAARLRHHWSGEPDLVDARGTVLDARGLAGAALDGPDAPARVQARLARLGIALAPSSASGQSSEPERGPAPESGAAAQSRVVAALGNVRVDGKLHDLLVTATGLLLTRGSRWSIGQRHLAGLVRSAESGPPAGSRFIAYRDVHSARLVRPRRVELRLLLLNGTDLHVRATLGASELGNAKERLLAIGTQLPPLGAAPEVVATPPPRTGHATLWGVFGLVFGLVGCAPLGIGLGALSIRAARRSGRRATLGIVTVVTATLVASCLFGLILLGSANER